MKTPNIIRKTEREHIKYLRGKGFDVKSLYRGKNNHLRILVDGKIKTTLSSTPSDRKSMKNSVKSINRLLNLHKLKSKISKTPD